MIIPENEGRSQLVVGPTVTMLVIVVLTMFSITFLSTPIAHAPIYYLDPVYLTLSYGVVVSNVVAVIAICLVYARRRESTVYVRALRVIIIGLSAISLLPVLFAVITVWPQVQLANDLLGHMNLGLLGVCMLQLCGWRTAVVR